MLVDAVVSNWDEVMVEGTGEKVGRGQEGRHQNSLFYTDDNMVALSEPGWIQGAFSTLVGIFDRVGLKPTSGRQS